MIMAHLHRSARGWVVKILVVLLIASLLLGGFWGYLPILLKGGRQTVAIVNGEKIDYQQLESIYQSNLRRLQSQWGESFAALAEDHTYLQGIKRQILEQLIDQQLYQHYTNQLALQIDDSEITATIQQISSFQTAGKFDPKRYQAILQENRLTEGEVQKRIKQNLIYKQLATAITNSEFVLPAENQRLYLLWKQQREIRTATIAVKPLIAKQSVEEAVAKKYYEEHLADFMTPERLKVRYLSVNASALLEGILVSDQEVESHYQKYPQRYSQPARQHIHLIRVATAEQAEKLLSQLKEKNGDFASLAKEHSTDTLTAAKGGEVGWIDLGNLPTALEQALTNLQPGQLSEVVQADDGYYLLRLNQQQAEQRRPLQQVKAEIIASLRQQKASEQFKQWQQQSQQLLDEQPENLAAIEKLIPIKAQESDWFSRNQPPAELAFAPVIQALFDKEPLPSAVEWVAVGSDQAVVIQLLARQASEQQPFEQVASKIIEEEQRKKAQQAARQQAETLLLTLREKPDERQKAMQEAETTWSERQWLTRQSVNAELVAAVFSHPKPTGEQPTYGLAENAEGDLVLFELLQIKATEEPQERKLYLAAFLRQRVEFLVNSLDASLRQHATITRSKL